LLLETKETDTHNVWAQSSVCCNKLRRSIPDPRRWRRHIPSKRCEPLTSYAASRRLMRWFSAFMLLDLKYC